MKRKNNGGFTMIEVLVAIVILAGIVVPVCSSLLLSLRMNAKAEQVLQARLAVSSAVETLMAEGVNDDNIELVEGKYSVDVTATADETLAYYDIVVTSQIEEQVAVTTCIRAAEGEVEEEAE